MTLFSHTVDVRDRTVVGEDSYGNDVAGWSELFDVAAWWEPRTSGEQTDARQQVTSVYVLYLEPDDPIDALSQVRLSGAGPWYEVDGEPDRQPGGAIVEGYVSVGLKLVTG